MKKLLISLMICMVGPAALACMPAPPGTPAFQLQLPLLSDMIRSEAVHDAIVSQGIDVRITSITPGATYPITLSNGCKLRIGRDDSNASPGTCPQLLPIVVEHVDCR